MPSSDNLARSATSAATSEALSLVMQAIQEQLREKTPEGVEAGEAWRRWQDLVAARNAVIRGATASSLLVQPVGEVSETVVDALVRTQDAYVERARANVKHNDAVDDHQETYLSEWRQRVKSHSRRSPEDMLSSLWDSGLSWRDIARLLKVSVAAVQKWRTGEKMSPKNFAHLRDFVAAYDMAAAHQPDMDIAIWLDVPILTDVPITPRHLWTDGDPGTFFEYALGNLSPEGALDALNPDWRRRYRDDGFETFVGDDGNLSIRTKDR